MNTSRWSTRPATVLAMIAPIWLLLAGTALAVTTINADVTSSLADGQVITVNVSGFSNPDPGQLTIVECAQGAVSIGGCDVAGTSDILFTNGDGTGSAPYSVMASPGRCDAATPCAIFAVESPNNSANFDNNTPGSRFASLTITFAGGGATTSMTSTTAPTTPTTTGPAPPPVVPEVAVTSLLPLSAAAVVSAGIVLALRRRCGGSDPRD